MIQFYDGKNPAVRLQYAIQGIAAARLLGIEISDEEIFLKNGYSSTRDFWLAALSRPERPDSFLHFLETFLLDPRSARGSDILIIKMRLSSSLDDMKLLQPEAFLNDKIINPMIAAKALVNMPLIADLIPASMREFFNPVEAPVERPTLEPQRPSKSPKLSRPSLKDVSAAIKQIEKESGKIPPQDNDLITRIQNMLPNHHVTREDMRYGHNKAYPGLTPGPRKRNYAK